MILACHILLIFFFIQIEMDALIINYIINLCSLCNKIYVKNKE